MTAQGLREHGFVTREKLDALRPDDVNDLGLMKADACHLKRVLEKKYRIDGKILYK
jgi:hypothetical protein